MNASSYTTTIFVDATPERIFNAINDVRGWWSHDIEGITDQTGFLKDSKVFEYHLPADRQFTRQGRGAGRRMRGQRLEHLPTGGVGEGTKNRRDAHVCRRFTLQRGRGARTAPRSIRRSWTRRFEP